MKIQRICIFSCCLGAEEKLRKWTFNTLGTFKEPSLQWRNHILITIGWRPHWRKPVSIVQAYMVQPRLYLESKWSNKGQLRTNYAQPLCKISLSSLWHFGRSFQLTRPCETASDASPWWQNKMTESNAWSCAIHGRNIPKQNPKARHSRFPRVD